MLFFSRESVVLPTAGHYSMRFQLLRHGSISAGHNDARQIAVIGRTSEEDRLIATATPLHRVSKQSLVQPISCNSAPEVKVCGGDRIGSRSKKYVFK
jgi:hypothetical protein